jgi:drug/metabolite transporter (DMT)-like permease
VRSYPALLLSLAALWGASYYFIKVGVEGGLDPSPLMALRALIAAVALLAYLLPALGPATALRELLSVWREGVVLGALNAALPFWLVAWGETHIDSGVAAVAQATVPICSLLIGLRFLPHERIGGLRWAGVGLGLVGVALLVGGMPGRDAWTVAGTLAIVLASVCYASAGIYGQLRLRGTATGPVLATASMIGGFLILMPPALLDLPTERPTNGAIASVLALALLGTALAQLLLFRMIGLYGARRLSLVTYLMPGFALAYGAVLLDEPLTGAALGGLTLILAGVALGSGAVGERLRQRAVRT